MYYSNIRKFTKADGAEIFYLIPILDELSKIVFVHVFHSIQAASEPISSWSMIMVCKASNL